MNNPHSNEKKPVETTAGFSLFELVVVVALVIILSTITLINYGQYSENQSFTLAFQDLMVTAREAQVYGIAVQSELGETPGTYIFPDAYGVHAYVDKNNPENNFIAFFADFDNDREYDSGEESFFFDLGGVAELVDVCANRDGVNENVARDCLSGKVKSTGYVTALYERPNPEAVITSDISGASTYQYARIILSDGEFAEKSAYLWATGQISETSDLPPAPAADPCPVVYVWDGEKYVYEHKAASLSSVSNDKTNIIPFETVGDTSDGIRLHIREDIDDTYMDSYKVFAVDTENDVEVHADSDGVLHTVGKIQPPHSCTSSEEDCTAKVAAQDGLTLSLGPDTISESVKGSAYRLITTFAKPEQEEVKLIVRSTVHPILEKLSGEFRTEMNPAVLYLINKGLTLPVIKDIIGYSMLVERLDLDIEMWNGDSWVSIGEQQLDDLRSLNTLVIPLSLSSIDDNEIKVRFQTQGWFLVEHVGLDLTEDEEFVIQEAPLLWASDEDAIKKIAENDGVFYEMPKGSTIDLRFGVPGQTLPHRTYLSEFDGYFLVVEGENSTVFSGFGKSAEIIKDTYTGNLENTLINNL